MRPSHESQKHNTFVVINTQLRSVFSNEYQYTSQILTNIRNHKIYSENASEVIFHYERRN